MCQKQPHYFFTWSLVVFLQQICLTALSFALLCKELGYYPFLLFIKKKEKKKCEKNHSLWLSFSANVKWHSVIKINETWASLVYTGYLVILTYHTEYNISGIIIQLEISNGLPNFRLIHLQITVLDKGHHKQQVWNFIPCKCKLSFPG